MCTEYYDINSALKPITPDEEYFIHMEDKLLTYLSKKGVDYAPLMVRVYEMLIKGFKYSEKAGCDFGYSIASKELLDILSDYQKEVSR